MSDRVTLILLAAVDNALRNGSYMTGANLAFDMLCDRLDVDRDGLTFSPGWQRDVPEEEFRVRAVPVSDTPAGRRGYDTAIEVFRGIHRRSGSYAAKWAADYLAADPDRMAPPSGNANGTGTSVGATAATANERCTDTPPDAPSGAPELGGPR